MSEDSQQIERCPFCCELVPDIMVNGECPHCGETLNDLNEEEEEEE